MCEIGRYKFKIIYMFARGPRYDLLLFFSIKKLFLMYVLEFILNKSV